MKKKLIAILLIAVILFSVPQRTEACNENQSDTYVRQILFGNQDGRYKSDDNVELLLSALYICSEQYDGNGQEKLDQLKSAGVGKIPKLEDIKIKKSYLPGCSHNSWKYDYLEAAEPQELRKSLLKRTVKTVFDFGGEKKKSDSFAALLYYSHILADYLVEDPRDTEASKNGYTFSAYAGSPYLDRGTPSFTEAEKKRTDSFIKLSELDSLGRCGTAFANIGSDIMPPENSRQSIGRITPSGWNQKKYRGLVNSNPPYLYNRCHLIAHQLIGEDGKKNLITGTRYLNIDGMKSWEDKVAKYIRDTGNHVLYRATPVFKGRNLVASGVQIEAYSVEDHGKGICFNVYCYNVQPGVDINYETGTSSTTDVVQKKNKILPFVVQNPGEDNPDLIYEMEKQLEILFEDQKDSLSYGRMKNEMERIAAGARQAINQSSSAAKKYANLDRYKYDLLKTLKAHVPTLLKKEAFFQTAFGNPRGDEVEME